MNPVKILLIIFSLLLGISCTSSRRISDNGEVWITIKTRLMFPRNFASVRINSHHEKELRVSYKKVLAMETYCPSGYSADYDMVFRQVSDGRRLFQVVFQGGVLKECDYTRDSSQILDFISSFSSPLNDVSDVYDIFTAYTLRNHSLEKNTTLAYLSFDDTQRLKQFSEIINIHSLHKKCRHFLDTATSAAKREAKSGNFTDIYSEILNNTDPKQISEFNKILAAAPLAVAGQNSHSHINTSEHNLIKRYNAPVKQSRTKRAAFDFNSVLIFPGTKWCGKGDLARCYEDLGDDQELDMCCRDHDCCPFVIPPFTQKFNMFNYRFHSLLHCDCDQRFRGCLRRSVSTMANMIGKIYFNILGSKCFDFQQIEVCAERSWWGRCRTYEQQVTAVVKNQVSFFEEEMAAHDIKEQDDNVIRKEP